MSRSAGKSSKARKDEIVWLSVDQIDPPEILLHPETDISELEELAQSIRAQGLINPITVRARKGRWQVVTGYRRWLACKKFGIPDIPACVMEMGERGALLATATENIQRTDLDPIEEGKLYQRLVNDHSLSPAKIAEQLGRSESYINARIDLLDMPEEVQQLVKQRKLKIGIVPIVKKLSTREEQIMVASDLAHRGYTIESAKHVVDAYLKYKREMAGKPKEEVLKKAEEEPTATCEWCRQMKLVKTFRALAVCDDCFRELFYLYERERREKGD